MRTLVVKASDRAVGLAVKVLRKNGVVIYPTETAYGIAVDATSNKAIKKIKAAKKRSGKFMPIIVSDMRMVRKYILLSRDMEKLVRKFMPGPLTLVCKKKNLRTARLLGGFRIPGNRFARRLVNRFGKPLTATSANISGRSPSYMIRDVIRDFYSKVDLIVDAGSLPRKRPSTVFDLQRMEIVRKGKITKRQIERVIKL